MEIFKLASNYQPSDSVRKYNSFVWVERYREAGEFQLTIMDDITCLPLLPLGTLISHTGTKEVMIVENHEFLRDDKKKITVTISGRSVETFLENRNRSDLNSFLASNPGYMAEKLVKDAVVVSVVGATYGLPNLATDVTLSGSYGSVYYTPKAGSVYPLVIEALESYNLGIKTIRPEPGVTTFYWKIHDGVDKRTTVIFYAQREDITEPNYFWSSKDYKNYVWLDGTASDPIFRTPDLGSDVTGWERREAYEDASDLTGSPSGTGNAWETRAKAILLKHRKVSLIDAKVSPKAKPKFKIDYDVGDLVKIFGEFGSAQDVRVTAHTLTIDEKGIRGYPTLTVL